MIGELAIAVAIIFSAKLIVSGLNRIEDRIDSIERKMTYVEGNTMLSAQHLEGIAADTVYIQTIRDRVDAITSAVAE